ncbi:serine/threonine-protein kinase WNK (With No Lysine)-like protein [Actinidia rufa]|uniref:Serine/threonine-protein kinase WNK (With No Lysine)-like protein n=1 Tax=Actinidia rufa TaxID=165716 RepID=A0A7J0EX82_9ERIC|nr:serine/threonine-protein kinase WNK (With No Lysine)-like protein [Actinidia rufa]
MGFAISPPPQPRRSRPGIVRAHRFMGTRVNINTAKGSNQNSSSRCLMKSTTMVKGNFIGKVAADHSHKWIYKEPNDQELNFLSSWQNSADSHPRTWEAQFQSGIKTIALIAVREGVVQLGAVHMVIEDLSYLVFLRKKFIYIESIPGVLLPHPASSAYPFKNEGYNAPEAWHFQVTNILAPPPPAEFYDHHVNQHMRITPSMSSLEALLSKLPSVVPPTAASVCRQLRGSSDTVFILQQADGTDGSHDRGGKGRD